ncbi:docking protein 2 isoform X2 [Coregonus clupeaformis]|uniref:docking protein 2 isoform X2 n=1 Tax=Coregonus clupeaformis TaxID=59861 RepID=UPI001BE0465C|nr:docking protein 2 isoform X2 [Coregonus clupeaformis]
MEEDIRKKGMLYLQQQRFGKKWKKVWSILYRESTCSISRLEFFEYKDGASTLEKSDKSLRKQQESKKVIKLSDCIRVSEVDIEGSPKDCGQFHVETADKLFVFAAEMVELDDWTQKLCEIAFPMNWGEKGGMRRSSMQRSKADPAEMGMEDNSLYSRRDSVKDFRVVVRRTEAAERCKLRGPCVLRTDFDSLLLKEPKSGEVLFSWPYRFLRRFGRDKVTFSFEAGRRCDSGEGSFEFDTKQGNMLFQALESAINLQRSAGQPLRQASGGQEMDPGPRLQPAGEPGVYSTINEALQRGGSSPPHLAHAKLEAPTEKLLTGVKSLTLDTRGIPCKNQVKNISSCPLMNSKSQTYSEITMPLERREQEDKPSLSLSAGPNHSSEDSDYSLPFDTIAKNLMADILLSVHLPPGVEPQGSERSGCQEDDAPDPLYDSIDESAIRSGLSRSKGTKVSYTKAEHIYDEPEGCAAAVALEPNCPTSVYDDPEEVGGHAWKIMGTIADPNGHEYPYNPHVDDYAVPMLPKRAFPPDTLQHEEEENSPYDNVRVKMN